MNFNHKGQNVEFPEINKLGYMLKYVRRSIGTGVFLSHLNAAETLCMPHLCIVRKNSISVRV
jgi:hypothetical protein